MKFYYEGKLVRTSANHIYTHAIITKNGGVLACASSYDRAQGAMVATTATPRDNLGFNRKMLWAVQNDKLSFWYKNKLHFVNKTKEELEKSIAHYEDYLNNLKIVELERGE